MKEQVLLILADGMRPDSIAACGEDYALQFLAESASWERAETVMPSLTLPCHMSLIHSVPPECHGVLENVFVPMTRPVPGLFDQLALYGRRCGFFYGWGELRDLYQPDAPVCALFRSAEKLGGEAANHWLTDQTAAFLREESPDFTFLYLPWPDLAGHDSGWMSGPYLTAVADVWRCIRQVTEGLPETCTVVVTADHGGHSRIHGCDVPEDMAIPLMIRGPHFLPGNRGEAAGIMDIAPTICRILEVPPSGAWKGESLLP